MKIGVQGQASARGESRLLSAVGRTLSELTLNADAIRIGESSKMHGGRLFLRNLRYPRRVISEGISLGRTIMKFDVRVAAG